MTHESKDLKDSKDTSATRILLIIREICNGKDINALSLSDFDFNISKRTFQRDIKKVKDFFIEHFAYISIATDSHTSTLKIGGALLNKNNSRIDSQDSHNSNFHNSHFNFYKSNLDSALDSANCPLDSAIRTTLDFTDFQYTKLGRFCESQNLAQFIVRDDFKLGFYV